ncbi:DM9 repeat-containing protein [Litoreibacter arenae]|uniref:Peptidoglycan binding-like domain-containing protein n=1 Tax=Litoreibacter arenae DSM 19593 TaxID=1123360 RepID=S9QJY4_9RHOB|nr:DM9 repeat-containing protein [Litoreibacter arenae]EPX81771.1 hypothetical protein thalar_00329 [Litoreibacter arenae DSM 19593]
MAHYQAALGGAFLTFLGSIPAAADMNPTEERLFLLLKSKPSFMRAMPAGREMRELVFKGRAVPGPLEWGESPTEIGIKPIGLVTHVARNCSNDTVGVISDTFKASYEQTQSWEVTVGTELTNSVEVTASLPGVVETTAGTAVTLKFEGSKGGETKSTKSHDAGYSIPVKPGRELDVQFQITEQVIEGTPFSIEMELLGKVEITHPPQGNWVRYRGSVPAKAVSAGKEWNAAGTKRRDLWVCRAAGSPHIGKVIGRRCNYGYGGQEKTTTNFDVLVVAGLETNWVGKSQFESGDDYDEDIVAEGKAEVFYGGQESRPTKRYKGWTFVCRAKHKGDFHPGKVVTNDCMIGYGGKELQKGRYEVLMRGKEVGDVTPVDLQDHLPDAAERTFVVEGVFEDARSFGATTVFGTSRPVNRTVCPGYVPPQNDTSIRDVEVRTSEPVTYSGDSVAIPAAYNDSREQPKEPKAQGEPAINGTVLAKISYGENGEARATLVSRILRDLRADMFGADVVAVQQALNDAGAALQVDGYFGAKTARALREFQRAQGLSVDGVFGPQSQNALGL